MTMVATGGTGNSVPVVSNLESVRAANKAGRVAQMEQRPQDLMRQRLKRKQDHEAAKRKLDTVQTPLVEALRRSKKRMSEANRHQKNYSRTAKKTRVPKELHPSLTSSMGNDDSATM